MKQIPDGTIITIGERERSSMVSTWVEYLTISKGREKPFLLSTAMYEALAEAEPYFNEDTEDYVLPDQIDGKTVVDVHDGWVMGGELVVNIDDYGYEFSDLDDPRIPDWLKETKWNLTIDLNGVKAVAQQN